MNKVNKKKVITIDCLIISPIIYSLYTASIIDHMMRSDSIAISKVIILIDGKEDSNSWSASSLFAHLFSVLGESASKIFKLYYRDDLDKYLNSVLFDSSLSEMRFINCVEYVSEQLGLPINNQDSFPEKYNKMLSDAEVLKARSAAGDIIKRLKLIDNSSIKPNSYLQESLHHNKDECKIALLF